MTAAATLVSQHPPQQDYQGKDFKMLFHPKKIPLEVHNMLSTSSLLGAASFFSWWRHANQSNDFWIETADEMIRVHVAPRRTLFSPAKWKTSNTSLLGSLLSSLVGDRVTESVSVLSEGTVIKSLQDSFQHDTLVEPEGGLWIGRSRFVKRNFEPAVDPTVPSDSLSSHALSSNSPFGMEDEEGRAASRAGGTGSSSPQHLDGARAEDYVDGKQEHEPTSVEEGCRRDEGAHQVHLGRTHQGGPRPGDPIAREANSRLARESKSTPAETIVPFGKFKGWLYREVPVGYLEWAIKEVAANPNHHPDLARLASWGKEELARLEKVKLPTKHLVQDPEAMAKVPPPSVADLRGAISSDSSWSRVGGFTPKPRRTRRLQETNSSDDETAEKEEIAMLKTRLAILEARHESKDQEVKITDVKMAPAPKK